MQRSLFRHFPGSKLFYRFQLFLIDFHPEYLRPRVVTGNIQVEFPTNDAVGVQFGHQNVFLVVYGPGQHDCTIGQSLADCGVCVEPPFPS